MEQRITQFSVRRAIQCNRTKAKQLVNVFNKLKQLLVTEWPNLRSKNLGVKSGTAVIEDILTAQLHHLCAELQLLAISDEQAADALVSQVQKLDKQHFQQLQGLLDAMGHEDLTDFLKLLVGQLGATASGSKLRAAARAAKAHDSSSSSRTTGGQLPAGILKKTDKLGSQLPGGASGTLKSDWKGHSWAGGVFDWLADGMAGGNGNSSMQHTQISQSLPNLKSLRFAALLPAGHMLTKTAEELQRQHEFQAALQAAAAAKAAAAAAPKGSQQSMGWSLPSLRQIEHGVGKYEQCSPGLLKPAAEELSSIPDSSHGTAHTAHDPFFLWPFDDGHGHSVVGLSKVDSRLLCSVHPTLQAFSFQAPSRDVEQLWRAGRKAVTELVMELAHLDVHESPLDTVMLAPVVPVQTRVPHSPSPVSPMSNSPRPTSSKAGNRKGFFASSRPTSAAAEANGRRAGCISSCEVAQAEGSAGVGPAPPGGHIAEAGNSCVDRGTTSLTSGAPYSHGAAAAAAASSGQHKATHAAADAQTASSTSSSASPSPVPFGTGRRAAAAAVFGSELKPGSLLDYQAGSTSSTVWDQVPNLQLSRLGPSPVAGAPANGGGQNVCHSSRPGSAANTHRPGSASRLGAVVHGNS